MEYTQFRDEIFEINNYDLDTENNQNVEKEEKNNTKSVKEFIRKKKVEIFEGYNDFLEEPRNFAKTNIFESENEEKKNNYPNQEKIIIRPIEITSKKIFK